MIGHVDDGLRRVQVLLPGDPQTDPRQKQTDLGPEPGVSMQIIGADERNGNAGENDEQSPGDKSNKEKYRTKHG